MPVSGRSSIYQRICSGRAFTFSSSICFHPGPSDPEGVHKVIWDELQEEPFELPPDKPLTLATYSAGAVKTAYVEPVAVGDLLPEMPLFLQPEASRPRALRSDLPDGVERLPRRAQGAVVPALSRRDRGTGEREPFPSFFLGLLLPQQVIIVGAGRALGRVPLLFRRLPARRDLQQLPRLETGPFVVADEVPAPLARPAVVLLGGRPGRAPEQLLRTNEGQALVAVGYGLVVCQAMTAFPFRGRGRATSSMTEADSRCIVVPAPKGGSRYGVDTGTGVLAAGAGNDSP